MNHFQIVEITRRENNAGTKATEDVAVIANRLGFAPVNVKMNTTPESLPSKLRRQIGYYFDWKNVEHSIGAGSVLLLQHPFHHRQLTRELTLKRLKNKGVKFVSIVHDVEELRAYRYNAHYAREYQTMLQLADVLIVHNKSMKQWFLEQGVSEEKLICIEIFDYLTQDDHTKQPLFEKSISVAGNLDPAKSRYVTQLKELEGVNVHLWGSNYDEQASANINIEYHGAVSSNELPQLLNRGFGLVWDGESIDSCEGHAGRYLKYNAPHKLSLYMVSGLPVVIWAGAAEAEYVRKNGTGICINSLRDLKEIFASLTEEEYAAMAKAASEQGKLCASGYHTQVAIKTALSLIE